MNDVQAKNCFLWVNNGTDYLLAGCMKSMSLEFTVDDIEITTADSTADREYEAGFSSASGTFEGITELTTSTKYKYDDFVDDRRIKRAYRIGMTAANGDTVTFDFAAKIQKVSMNSTIPGLSNFSVTYLVSGAVVKTVVSGGVTTMYLLDGFGEYIVGGAAGDYIIV